MSYGRQISRGSVWCLYAPGSLFKGIQKIQEILAMEVPESTDSFAFCLVAEFSDSKLLATEAFWQFRKSQ
jgi:hypothetical protein